MAISLVAIVLGIIGCGSANSTPVELQISFGARGPVANNPVSFGVANVPFKPADIRYYRWFFGDGASQDGPTATHSYATSGQYAVVLQIGLGWDVPVNMKTLGADQRVQADGEHLMIFRKEIVIGD